MDSADRASADKLEEFSVLALQCSRRGTLLFRSLLLVDAKLAAGIQRGSIVRRHPIVFDVVAKECPTGPESKEEYVASTPSAGSDRIPSYGCNPKLALNRPLYRNSHTWKSGMVCNAKVR